MDGVAGRVIVNVPAVVSAINLSPLTVVYVVVFLDQAFIPVVP
jgi:hypothetical protein